MGPRNADDLEIEHASSPMGSSHSSDRQEKEQLLDEDPVYSYAEQRKIIHRLDRRLITIAGIIYMNSLMDRSNLPNAAIVGMNEDLGMVEGFRYVSRLRRQDSITLLTTGKSTVALVFFVTYTVFQPPAIILTRKIGPQPFLSGICLAWGAVMVSARVYLWVVVHLTSSGRLWLCARLEGLNTTETSPGTLRSWVLPRCRLPYLNLVLEVRYAEALCSILQPWSGRIWVLGHPRIWCNANGMFSSRSTTSTQLKSSWMAWVVWSAGDGFSLSLA